LISARFSFHVLTCSVRVQVSNAQLADTTSKLQEEKLRLDALLVRQYNLLAVLGGNRARGMGPNGQPLNTHETHVSNSTDHSSMGSKEGLTLGGLNSMWTKCCRWIPGHLADSGPGMICQYQK
jgi:hypothetical protein